MRMTSHAILSNTYMNDIFVFKAPHDVHNGITLTDRGQKGVSQPFSRRCTLDETGHIHKFQSGRYDLGRIIDLGQDIEFGVGNGNNARVGFNGTEWVVGSFLKGSKEPREKTVRVEPRDGSDAIHCSCRISFTYGALGFCQGIEQSTFACCRRRRRESCET